MIHMILARRLRFTFKPKTKLIVFKQRVFILEEPGRLPSPTRINLEEPGQGGQPT
jgi:hypothetical protein